MTGAGRGLGRAIALGLAAHGADVLAVSRSPREVDQVAEAARALGRRALSLAVDISVKSDVAKMAALVRDEWGKADILVNNAGVDRNQPAIDYEEDEWDRIVGTNLKGYFLCSQAIGRLMVAQGSGSIVMNSSIYGSVGAADNLPYGASKGGVNQLTRMLAVEWAPHSVRVNAIAPGYMTPMNSRRRAGRAGRQGRGMGQGADAHGTAWTPGGTGRSGCFPRLECLELCDRLRARRRWRLDRRLRAARKET